MLRKRPSIDGNNNAAYFSPLVAWIAPRYSNLYRCNYQCTNSPDSAPIESDFTECGVWCTCWRGCDRRAWDAVILALVTYVATILPLLLAFVDPASVMFDWVRMTLFGVGVVFLVRALHRVCSHSSASRGHACQPA